jgi:succinyl-CoA synthetase beta subunit
MNLHEYQAKQLFARYGLPAPVGYACTTPREAEEAASKIGSGPWVVKCQVHAGGRGKAGGVKVVNSKEEIRAFAEHWLGKRLVTYQTDANGQPVNQILVEAATDIAKELYLGAVVDRSSRRVVFMASTEGGVEIEKVAEETPHLIHKVAIDPLAGPMPYQGRELAFKLGLEGKLVQQFTKIFMGLANIFLERDLALIEINPLVITKQGDLICLDGKLGADGNALFRQSDLREMRDQSQEDPREAQAAHRQGPTLPHPSCKLPARRRPSVCRRTAPHRFYGLTGC